MQREKGKAMDFKVFVKSLTEQEVSELRAALPPTPAELEQKRLVNARAVESCKRVANEMVAKKIHLYAFEFTQIEVGLLEDAIKSIMDRTKCNHEVAEMVANRYKAWLQKYRAAGMMQVVRLTDEECISADNDSKYTTASMIVKRTGCTAKEAVISVEAYLAR